MLTKDFENIETDVAISMSDDDKQLDSMGGHELKGGPAENRVKLQGVVIHRNCRDRVE